VAASPERFVWPALFVQVSVVVHQQVTRKRTIDEAFIIAHCITVAIEKSDDASGRVEAASHRHRDTVRRKWVESDSTIANRYPTIARYGC
jgi:hypothetical protein